jgi:hypothetical protein
MYILQMFYLTPFLTEADFYGQFEARRVEAEQNLGV